MYFVVSEFEGGRKMIQGCCKDCRERVPRCHMTCEKYLAYRERLEEARARRRKESFRTAVQLEAIGRGQKLARRNRRKK